MHIVSFQEAQQRLADLIKEVQGGEEVVILTDNEPVAKLVKVTRAGYGSLQGQITMADDFDAPLQDFLDYMP